MGCVFWGACQSMSCILAAPVLHTRCYVTELTLVLLVLDCVCTRKAHSGTYRTRIRTQLLFRPSLLGGVSCVYSRCSARDSTDSRLTDSATDTYTARGGVSKIGPNGHMETRRQLPVCRVARSVTGRQRGASIRGRANGSHPLS